jgi:uncharacterized membrane protein YgaE (UPF0421/DUF939 family)
MSKGLILVMVGLIVAILFLLFLIRNTQDKKQLEENIKRNYRKKRANESDTANNIN